MNKKPDILCDEDVPEKHLLNSKEFEIGIGTWENGASFYGMRRRKEEEKKEDYQGQ